MVTDPAKRAALADFYREGFKLFYGDTEAALAGMPQDDPVYLATQSRVVDSATYLAEHMARGAGPRDPLRRGPLRRGAR